jgi:hypothetical protein
MVLLLSRTAALLSVLSRDLAQPLDPKAREARLVATAPEQSGGLASCSQAVSHDNILTVSVLSRNS